MMVWLFILLTVVTYGFVMKYVLHHIQKTGKVAKKTNTFENEQMTTLITVQSAR